MSATRPTVLSCEQVRFVDRFAIETWQVPGILLMENAGRGCVDWLQELGCTGPVLVLCGPGNNGGDGLVIARHLQIRGIEVGLGLLSDPRQYRGDAAVNWQICQHLNLPRFSVAAGGPSGALKQLAASLFAKREPEWIVDAMLGTGARGPLREPYLTAVGQANELSGRRFAVDIPSGLDAELGFRHTPVFRADATASFVAAKPGLVLESSQPMVGQLKVLDIGLPAVAIHEALRQLESSRPKGQTGTSGEDDSDPPHN